MFYTNMAVQLDRHPVVCMHHFSTMLFLFDIFLLKLTFSFIMHYKVYFSKEISITLSKIAILTE